MRMPLGHLNAVVQDFIISMLDPYFKTLCVRNL